MGLGGANLILLWNIVVSMGYDCCFEDKIPTLYSDSSAGRGMAMRSGVGKVKHIQTRFLWLQESIRTKTLKVDCIDTIMNTSDLGTKYLDKARRAVLMAMLPLIQFKGLERGGLVALVMALLPVAEADESQVTALDHKDDQLSGHQVSVWKLQVLQEMDLTKLKDTLLFASLVFNAFVVGCHLGKQQKRETEQVIAVEDPVAEKALQRIALQRFLMDNLEATLCAAGLDVGSSRLTKAVLIEVLLLTGKVRRSNELASVGLGNPLAILVD